MSLTARIQLALELEVPTLPFISEEEGSALYKTLKNERAVANAIGDVFEQMRGLSGYKLVTGDNAGAQRDVFIGKSTVIKLPLLGEWYAKYLANPKAYLEEFCHPSEVEFSPFDNVEANLIEVAAYETACIEAPTAPCRILWHESGIPIVVMEKLDLKTKKSYGEMPDWIEEYERNQIGWSKKLRSWAGFDAGQSPETTSLDGRKWLMWMQRRKKTLARQEAKALIAA